MIPAKKKKESSSLADYQNMTLDELANLHDADDEEIDEDSAFNSNDEKVFGQHFPSKRARSKNISLSIPLSQEFDKELGTTVHTVEIVEIAKGSKLTLSSACLDVSQFSCDQLRLMYQCIYPSQEKDETESEEAVDDDDDGTGTCLCNYLSVKKGGMGLMPVTPVNLEVAGPCKIEFGVTILAPKSKTPLEGSMNIFGIVVPVDHFVGEDAPFRYADASASEDEDGSVAGSVASNSNSDGDDDVKSDKASMPATKKRKLEEDAVEEKRPLTKKQRKKLAQEKARQLEETLSDARSGDASNNESVTNDATSQTKKSKKKKKKANDSIAHPAVLTRERRLAGGLVISDILLGAGAPVKPGKRISLHYTGSLKSTGHVFDKNNSKQHPLVFRQGTGEVIRGLERGLEGMKVGGERVVTVPSKLGYGSKGAGDDIPPDSDLVFEVKVLKVG